VNQASASGAEIEAWMASDYPALAAWWAPLEAWERTRLLAAMVRAHAGF
jgi:hypothetical protein